MRPTSRTLSVKLDRQFKPSAAGIPIALLRLRNDILPSLPLSLFAGRVVAGTKIKVGDLDAYFPVEMQDHIRLVAVGRNRFQT